MELNKSAELSESELESVSGGTSGSYFAATISVVGTTVSITARQDISNLQLYSYESGEKKVFLEIMSILAGSHISMSIPDSVAKDFYFLCFVGDIYQNYHIQF